MSTPPAPKRPRTAASSPGSAVAVPAPWRHAASEDVVLGALLPTLATDNLQDFAASLPPGHSLCLGKAEKEAGPPLKLRWGTCCSGSEGARYVFEAAEEALRRADVPVVFDHVFSCEINPKKQAWIAQVLEAGNVYGGGDARRVPQDEMGCVFGDIAGLDTREAFCSVHNGMCPVPQVDCLCIGTSCKDLSRANSSVDRTKLVLSQETSKGASAQTFRGMLAYCEGHRPTFVIFENVDSIDDKITASQETNLGLLMGAMSDLGYEGQKAMTDAHEFGLPCRRRRLYVLFVDGRSPKLDLRQRALGQVFETFRRLLTTCMRLPPCSTQCVFTASMGQEAAEILEAALRCRSEAAVKASQKKQPAPTWMDKRITYADKLGFRWAGPPPAELLDNPWYGTLTKREQDALILSRVDDPLAEFRNLSQSVGRINSKSTKADSGKETGPTMLPGQLLWVESQQRLLTGEEALNFQGFPILKLLGKVGVLPPELTAQGLLHDLAGNAMALPVLLAMIQAALASMAWKKRALRPQPAEDGDEDDIKIALAALRNLQHPA